MVIRNKKVEIRLEVAAILFAIAAIIHALR